MLIFKKGVKVFGLQPEILWALDVAERVFSEWGHNNATVTSGRGDNHSRKSKHNSGHASDLRSRIFTAAQIPLVVEKMTMELGPDYDFIFEVNHFHMEYDPKDKHEYPSERPYA